MARRLILDTGVIIAAERNRLDLHQVIGDDDPAISVITAMELLAGVEGSSPEYRDLIALNVESLLAVMDIEVFTVEVARLHALLQAYTRRQGQARGNYDLMIAATAGATGRTLITLDKAAKFDELPGVTAEVISRN